MRPKLWTALAYVLIAPLMANPIRTIVDIISEQAEFSTLVSLLQKHRLIPLINDSRNATLLAPVNSAFAEVNLKSITRETLLYHLLNESVVFGELPEHPCLLVPSYLNTSSVLFQDKILNHGKSEIIESDLMASYGRGCVHSISKPLQKPTTLWQAISLQPRLRAFQEILSLENSELLESVLTLFAPSNLAFSHFEDIQLTFLFSAYGNADRNRLVRRHVTRDKITPQHVPQKITMLDGSTVSVDRNLILNKSHHPADTWLVTSNGILNIYNELIGEDILVWNPLKYILALHGYLFTRELSFYGYESLIDGSYNEPLTVIVPGIESDRKVAESDNNAHTILYSFLDEQFSADSYGPGTTLHNTKLMLKSGKYPQKVRVSQRAGGKLTMNFQNVDNVEYRVGNTSIYTAPKRVPLPQTLNMAVGPLFMSSYSLAYLEDLDLLELPESSSWTLLLPTRDAWERMYLVKLYLDSRPELVRKVFEGLIISTPIYSDSEKQRISLLDGTTTDIEVQTGPNPHIRLGSDTYNTEIMDVLFDNGVTHCVSEVYFSPNLEITVLDLIQSGGRQEFINLLNENGFSNVLSSGENFTIFVPNLDHVDLKSLKKKPRQLERFLALHLVPGNPIEALLNDDMGVETLAGNYYISLNKVSDKTYGVGPSKNPTLRSFTVARGDTNGLVGHGSTVFYLNTYIAPDWFDRHQIGGRSFLLSGIVLGATLTILLIGFVLYMYSDPKSPRLLRDTDTDYHDDLERTESHDEDAEEPPTNASEPIRAARAGERRAYGEHLGLP